MKQQFVTLCHKENDQLLNNGLPCLNTVITINLDTFSICRRFWLLALLVEETGKCSCPSSSASDRLVHLGEPLLHLPSKKNAYHLPLSDHRDSHSLQATNCFVKYIHLSWNCQIGSAYGLY